MSCCCERDNSFVLSPGSLSVSGKADWPIYETGGKWWWGLMEWRGG